LDKIYSDTIVATPPILIKDNIRLPKYMYIRKRLLGIIGDALNKGMCFPLMEASVIVAFAKRSPSMSHFRGSQKKNFTGTTTF